VSLRSQSEPLTGVMTGTLSLLLILLALIVRDPALRTTIQPASPQSVDTLVHAMPPVDSLDTSEEFLLVDSVAAPAPASPPVPQQERVKPRVTRKPAGIFAAQVRVTLRWSEGKKRNRVAGRLPSGLRAKIPVRMLFDLVVTPSGHIRKVTVKDPGKDAAQRQLALNTIRTWRFAPLARNVRRRDQHCSITWIVQPAR